MSAYANNETEALKIAQNALKTTEPLTAEVLSGGLSGSALIKVGTADRACIVRFWNVKWAEYFPQDLACQVIASDAGYGPQVFFTDKINRISAMEYFLPEPLPEIQMRLHALVDLVKKIHTGPAFPKGIDKSRDFDETFDEVAKLNPQFFDLEILRAVKEAIFSATQDSASAVPCHRDLHQGNLIYNQNRFVAIDYTWSGMDDPYVDLATVAIFNCKTPEEEHHLLQLYLGRAPSGKEVARLSLMKVLAKIFYGLEFLKLASTASLKAPDRESKNYMNFGRHGETTSPPECLEYAISILSEAVDYAQSEQYFKDLLSLKNSRDI